MEGKTKTKRGAVRHRGDGAVSKSPSCACTDRQFSLQSTAGQFPLCPWVSVQTRQPVHPSQGLLSKPRRVCCQSLGGFSDQDVEQVANRINGSSSGLTWLTLLLQCSRFLFPSHAGEHPTPQEEGQRKERLGIQAARRIQAAHCRLLGKTNPQGRQSQAT